jgi:hypothetical protein
MTLIGLMRGLGPDDARVPRATQEERTVGSRRAGRNNHPIGGMAWLLKAAMLIRRKTVRTEEG